MQPPDLSVKHFGPKPPFAHVDAPMRLERDPICGMLVDERENKYTYRGIGQTFCSQQCRERFAAAPGLYVGRRRLPAPKQRGVEMIKRTRVVVGAALSDAQFGALRSKLLLMMGVIAVRPIDGECGPRPKPLPACRRGCRFARAWNLLRL